MAFAVSSSVSAAVSCATQKFTPSATSASLNGPSSLAIARRPHSFSSAPWFGSRTALKSPALALISRIPSTKSGALVVTATIAVGENLPEAELSYFDKDGNVQAVSVSDLTKGKKVVLFAVPGAFTPTCSSKHLPGFVAKAEELRKAGVDTLACVSVNDAFVMQAWGKSAGVGDNVLMLSDGLGKFTQALGVTVDLSEKVEGLGVRSRRYSMLVEDGVVKVLNLEEGGAFTSSSAEEILSSLQKASV